MSTNTKFGFIDSYSKVKYGSFYSKHKESFAPKFSNQLKSVPKSLIILYL